MSEDKNNAVDDLYKATGDVANALTKVFLAGVGVVASTADKSKEVADKLVKRGEEAVSKGKAANEELTQKAASAVSGTTDQMLKAYLASLSPEERARFVEHVTDVAQNLEDASVQAAEAGEDAADEVAEDAAEVSEN